MDVEVLNLAVSAAATEKPQITEEQLVTQNVVSSNEVHLPYDISQENLNAENPFYFDCAAALKDGANIANKARLALSKYHALSNFPGDLNLNEIDETFTQLSLYSPESTNIIAILGESGAGKSSLINSLLNTKDLAQTGCMGAACTSVVTEFRQKLDHHTAPITIEVKRMTLPEMKQRIKSWISAFRLMWVGSEDGELDSRSEDKAQAEKEYQIAESSLTAVFREQASNLEGGLVGLLGDSAENSLQKARDTLWKWAEQLEWPEGEGQSGDDHIWTGTASTGEECNDVTEKFMEDSLWPFTKIIRIYLDAAILRTGVVLADLPGLVDSNRARVRVTEEYIMKCNLMFVVGQINRITTNASVQNVLKNAVPRNADRYVKMGIVCTRSADVDYDSLIRDLQKKSKKFDPLKVIVKQIMETETELTKHTLLLQGRICFIKHQLQTSYTRQVPGGTLEVFGIDNKVYKLGATENDINQVKLSGIPDLRLSCVRVSAEAQFLEVKNHFTARLPSCFNRFKLWADQSNPLSAIRDAQTRETFSIKIESMSLKVEDSADMTLMYLKDAIRQLIFQTGDDKLPEMQAHGRKTFESHGRWTGAQYNAWVRNDGDHSTPKRGSVNWNAEYVDVVGRILDRPFTELAGRAIGDIASQKNSKVEELFGKLIREIEVEIELLVKEAVALNLRQNLVSQIRLDTSDLLHKFKTMKKNLFENLRDVRRRSFEGGGGSYFLELMMFHYEAAAEMKGKGKKQMQINHIQVGLEGTKERVNGKTYRKSIYHKLVERTRDGANDVVDGILGQLKRTVKEFLDKIAASLSLSVGTSEVQDRKRIQYLQSPDGKELVKEMEGLMTDLESMNVRNGFTEPQAATSNLAMAKIEKTEPVVVKAEPVADPPTTDVDPDEDSLFVPEAAAADKKRKHQVMD